MTKVLEVNVDDQDSGGVYSLVRNVIMHNDTPIKIDIAAIEKFVSQEHIRELNEYGTAVYYIGYEGSKWRKQIVCYKNLKKLLQKKGYDAVHIHADVANKLLVSGLAAKSAGTKKIILHSHATGVDGNHRRLKRLFHYSSRRFLKYIGNCYVACSDVAAKWMFPNVRADEIKIIKNGIDLEKFRFNPEKRKRVRSELGIQEELLIGHVGRFSWQKNHDYLIEIMKAVRASGVDAKLLLIGEGPDEGRIRRKVQEYGLVKDVIFYGVSSKVNELYQAMDVFVLPSNFEGLPIVGVEAQAAGLPVVFSSEITRQAKLTDYVNFIEIGEENIGEWAERIVRLSKFERKDTCREIREKGFDIRDTVAGFIQIYIGGRGVTE